MSEINAGSVSVYVVPDLRKFKPEVEAKTKGMKATIGVDADTAEAEAQVDEAARDRRANVKVDVDRSSIDRAAGSVSGLTTAILALGPALVPVTGALVGAGGAFGASALAGGAGAGALGASLIGNIKNVLTAQKDLSKAKQDAATASQNQLTANRAVISSEQQLSMAQGQRKIAQMSLTQAQDSARLSLRALSDQIKGAALAEGDASIAVRQARKNLNDTMKNRKSTQLDRDAARQSYKDALFQLDQVKKRRQEISTNAAKERKAGVEGNAQVIAARQGVASANASVASAQRSVTAARENAKKATDAYRVAQQSLADTQKVLSGPAAAGFVKSLGRAKNAWKDYLKVTAGPSFQVASKGLGLFSTLLPNVGQLSNIAARAVGGLLGDLKAFGKADTARGFLDFFKTFEGPAITQFGHIVGNLTLGVGGLLKAFAPVGLQLGAGLETLTKKFANFGTNAGSNKGFQGFLAYVQQVGPQVADTFGHLVGAAVQIGIYLAPLGGMVLGLVDGLAKFIIKADPATLDTIAVAIGGVALAFGKGPLGLAFALGAVLAHKDGFVSFLKKAGELAGTLADAFNSLPTGIKQAAIAAVGVGVIGAKLNGLSKGLGQGGGLLGLVKSVKPIPVFVTNPGFGTGSPGTPGVPPVPEPKTPGKLPSWLLPFAMLGPTVGSIGNEVKTLPTLHSKALSPNQLQKLPKDDLQRIYKDVLKNGLDGASDKQTTQYLRDIQAAADKIGTHAKSAKGEVGRIAGAFTNSITQAQRLNNEVKLIGSNARGSRAEVRRLMAAINAANTAATLLAQGVTSARTSKVDGQLGRGSQEFRGVLSIDKNGIAYINGVAQSAVKHGRKAAHREAVGRAGGGVSY